MKIRIGTVDGHIHESKSFTWADVEADLAENNHLCGHDTGGSEIYCRTLDEFENAIGDFLTYDTRNTHQTFTMELPWAKSRKFNVRHIVWWEIWRDEV